MEVPSSATSRAVADIGNGSDDSNVNASNGVAGRGPDTWSAGGGVSLVPVTVAVNGSRILQSPHEALTCPVAVPAKLAPETVRSRPSYRMPSGALHTSSPPIGTQNGLGDVT